MENITSILASNETLSVAEPVIAQIVKEVDLETCQLLGGFALVIQALMGVLVIGALLLKRATEKPKRKWRVWGGDVSKQLVGQAFVHATNVFSSDLIARHKANNPCSLYAMAIFIDCSIGIFILYAFLRLLTSLLSKYDPRSFKTGSYGNPFNYRIWMKQAGAYVVCLGGMKIVVLVLFWIVPGLFGAADWCLSWFSDDVQVVISMLLTPVVMNIAQFLIIDSFLKSKSPLLPTKEDDDDSSSSDEFNDPFLLNNSDSEDESDEEEPRSSKTANRAKKSSEQEEVVPDGGGDLETGLNRSGEGSGTGTGSRTPPIDQRIAATLPSLRVAAHSYPPILPPPPSTMSVVETTPTTIPIPLPSVGSASGGEMEKTLEGLERTRTPQAID